MLSPQAGAVLLNTFLSMHKKCFNYFELNWKFICKRVIFKNINIALARTANGFWALKKKKKKKKNSTASIDLRSWRDQGWRIPILLAAYSKIHSIGAFRLKVPPATQAIRSCLQILSSRTALTNSKYNFFSQSFRVQFLGRRTSTALGVSAAHQQSSLLLLINRKIWASFLMTFVSA